MTYNLSIPPLLFFCLETKKKVVKDTKFGTSCSPDLNVDSDEPYPPILVSVKSENCPPASSAAETRRLDVGCGAAPGSGSALAGWLAGSAWKFSLLTNGFGASGNDRLDCQSPGFANFRKFFFVLFFGRVTVCVRVCEMKAEIERGGGAVLD